MYTQHTYTHTHTRNTRTGADDTNAPHHPDSSVVNGAQLAGGVVCTPTTITHTSSASPAAGVAGAECKVVVWNHGGAAVVMQVCLCIYMEYILTHTETHT